MLSFSHFGWYIDATRRPHQLLGNLINFSKFTDTYLSRTTVIANNCLKTHISRNFFRQYLLTILSALQIGITLTTITLIQNFIM